MSQTAPSRLGAGAGGNAWTMFVWYKRSGERARTRFIWWPLLISLALSIILTLLLNAAI